MAADHEVAGRDVGSGRPIARSLDPEDEEDRQAAGRLRYRWWIEDRGDGDPDEATFTARFADFLTARPDSHRGIAVEVGGVIAGVGWVVLIDRMPWPDDDGPRAGLLQAVYVDPEMRGRGAGTILIEGILAEARSHGLKYVLVNPTERSEPLYRRLGFRGAEPPLRLDLRTDGT